MLPHTRKTDCQPVTGSALAVGDGTAKRMTPHLIGYFPKRTLRRATGWKLPPPRLDELCNVACASDEPANWTDLWLHNEMWVYDTELLAWAVATDLTNLKCLTEQASSQPYAGPGSVDQADSAELCGVFQQGFIASKHSRLLRL